VTVSGSIISAFLDNQPRFFMQAWNWLNCLRAQGTAARADIVLHHPPGIDGAVLNALSRLGARMVEVQPFGSGQAVYCNKIRQLTSGACNGYEYVILSDLDIAFLQCPTGLVDPDRIRAKIVDAPNPPKHLLDRLVEEAGLGGQFVETPLELFPDQMTLSPNCNGGLYVLPGWLAGYFGPAWERWARFCLQRQDVLTSWTHHADQVGFLLAVGDLGAPFSPLAPGANFPVHFDVQHLSTLPRRALSSLHYHDRLDSHGLILPTGVEWIDAAIGKVNDVLSTARREDFDNMIFWTFRYTTDPGLGSGVGSRGGILADKQELLLPFARALSLGSVLDVGCGDLEVTSRMPFASYVGIDISPAALAIAREKRPDWTFKAADLPAIADGSFDLVICLDVLIHQHSASAFQELLTQLVRIARGAVIASGYPGASNPTTGIVFHHGDLSEALEAMPGVKTVQRLGGYRGLDVILAVKEPFAPTSTHDLDFAGLAAGCRLADDWQTLLALVAQSRAHIGFFPRTIIRCIEYPWFAARLGALKPGSVLDLGAGLSVMPFWLADEGWDVLTVDLHPLDRTYQPRHEWNEWGYLDYASLDRRISSHHVDAALFSPEKPLDVIYSVSVIEHMPAQVRRSVIARFRDWLKPGGHLLLSVDLVPDTDLLWRWSEGVAVDPEDLHGTFTTLLQELADAGLDVSETDIRRRIEGSRTDLGFIVANA